MDGFARWPWGVALAALAVVLPTRASIPAVVVVLLSVRLSRWWVRRVARGLEVRCDAPRWAAHGEEIEAVVVVRNTTRLPAAWAEVDVASALALGRSAPQRAALSLLPGESFTCRVPLRCSQRGRHEIGPPRLRVGDVLGAAAADASGAGSAAVTVFPRIVPLRRLGLPASSPFATVPNPNSLLTDPTSVVGVRDYRAGDPQSSIHWTGTARAQRLLVKQYERAESRDTLVCLDLSPGGYPRGRLQEATELAITVAASVLHHCIAVQGLPAGLVTGSGSSREPRAVLSVPPRSDEGHLRRALELLALVQAGTPVSLAQLLAGLRTGLPPGTTVLAVTGKLDDDATAHLLRLARAGVPVAVALTGPSTGGSGASDHPRLPVYRVADLPAAARLAA